jgi:hypothetical protein
MIKYELLNFINPEAKSPFSPRWDYTIGLFDINEIYRVSSLFHFLLEKEKEILKKYTEASSDGGTGLGPNSLTSKYKNYTIWEFEELSFLKKIIKECHDIYLDKLNLPEENNVYCQGWFNVMRSGEKIKRHIHSDPESSYNYLSAHITVTNSDTHTNYFNPITNEEWKEKNYSGKLTIFPSYISHSTDSVPEDDPRNRITLAFDMITEEGYHKDIFENKKCRWHKL